ncbi:MAG TPA: TIGR04282 family arsenosugar biosynthesis glycosyltransferase [Candidatus Saccharimonadales bacterium]|nr:TIGR04282 family arsenosugar biosynthesis glycosyltransferase [Candidatus Saccharimonadales bacterium]
MPARDSALVIFARAPRPGAVKTRLGPVFTPEEACEIHLALAGDVVERSLRAVGRIAEVVLSWSEAPAAGSLPAGFPSADATELQGKGDLGERMALTMQARLRGGYRRVAILGSDVPTLPDDHLRSAFELLGTREVVLGPATDGGYYLIGMSRLHLNLFRGMEWGSSGVIAATKKRLKSARVPHGEIGPWHDVDTAEDVSRLWGELTQLKARHPEALPTRTWEVLRRLAPGRAAG